MTRRNWTYEHCFLVGHHDGDTITVNIDLGRGEWWLKQPVRLYGVACNELKDPGGPEASAAVDEWCRVGEELLIVSWDLDKYGRIMGEIYKHGSPWSLNQFLIQNGWAVPWDGTGKQPKVPWPRGAA